MSELVTHENMMSCVRTYVTYENVYVLAYVTHESKMTRVHMKMCNVRTYVKHECEMCSVKTNDTHENMMLCV